MAKAFGMNVKIAARPGESSNNRGEVERTPIKELLGKVDFLTLHCPLNEETRDLFTYKELKTLKPGAMIINCARGGIINEKDLAQVLSEGHLGGAAVDVLTQEPPSANQPLLDVDHPNFIMTPHIAWGNLESRQLLVEKMAGHISTFLSSIL